MTKHLDSGVIEQLVLRYVINYSSLVIVMDCLCRIPRLFPVHC